MRRYLVGLALLAIVAAACAPESSTTSAAGPSDSGAPAMTPAECAEAQSSALFAADTLTIATGNPAYVTVVRREERGRLRMGVLGVHRRPAFR